MIIKRYDAAMEKILHDLVHMHLSGNIDINYLQRIRTFIETGTRGREDEQTMVEQDIIAYIEVAMPIPDRVSKLYEALSVFRDLNHQHREKVENDE